MAKVKETIKWLFKAWPVLFLMGLILIHLGINTLVHYDYKEVNKYISVALQMIGGIIILISVNENIADFKRGNLWSMLVLYFKSCPLRKQNVTLNVASSTHASTVGGLTLISRRKWNTDEERFLELERQIDETWKLIFEKEKSLIELIDSNRTKLETKISKNNQEILDVSSRLDKSVLGNIKFEIFGVLLMLYGAFLNLI